MLKCVQRMSDKGKMRDTDLKGNIFERPFTETRRLYTYELWLHNTDKSLAEKGIPIGGKRDLKSATPEAIDIEYRSFQDQVFRWKKISEKIDGKNVFFSVRGCRERVG